MAKLDAEELAAQLETEVGSWTDCQAAGSDTCSTARSVFVTQCCTFVVLTRIVVPQQLMLSRLPQASWRNSSTWSGAWKPALCSHSN